MKHNYSEILDFLNDDSFVQWVLFGEDENEWKKFLLANPNKQSLVNEARLLIKEVNTIEEKRAEELSQNIVWAKLMKSIGEDKNAEKTYCKKT